MPGTDVQQWWVDRETLLTAMRQLQDLHDPHRQRGAAPAHRGAPPAGAWLETVDAETAGMIDAEAGRLAAWLGPTRIRWPFPPP
jgi:hypothetical protein